MNVIVKDKAGRTESNLTDKDGKAVVPPTTFDITDKNGYGELNEYSITVVDETKPLENVSLTLNEDGSITVLLPTESKIVHTNRITVTVVNKTEKTPVKDVSVTVSEAPKAEDDEQAAEPKTANGKTDENGKVIVPPLSEDITDGDGNSDVTNKEEKPGEDTNGDGTEDKPGEVITTTYNVALADTKGNIPNALVKIEDGKVYITIPDTHTLTTSNQITATVTDGENKLNRFTDVNDSSKWYFADVNEASNEHIGITTSEGETWTK